MTDDAERHPGETERAEDHYGHRDEDDRWGDPVEARGPETLSVIVSVRFSRAEADLVGITELSPLSITEEALS